MRVAARIIFSKSLRLKPVASKEPLYIVSLTSYGKRVRNSAPYAIYTLLNQSVLPDKIVLWLDNDNWNKKNTPFILKKLERFGLEIRFCEDLKSYKKLIPALEAFPNDYIITADDDLYYPNNWLEQLLTTHKENPQKIICHRANGIKVDENHQPLPYMQWDMCIEPGLYFTQIMISLKYSIPAHRFESIFPTSGGGMLFPPKCFHNDVKNKKMFMKLAPKADDIWFWAMVAINQDYFMYESPYVVIHKGYSKNLQKICLQKTNSDDSLWFLNQKGGNDTQLKAVICQYPQINNLLQKILPFQQTNKEHFVPNQIHCENEYVLYLLHLFAYALDSQYVNKNNYLSVLDYASGDGYGSFFIANSCPQAHVVGVDIDSDAIKVANKKYNLNNLQFMNVNEIRGKRFDFICLHQIIEHVDNPNEFLHEIKDLLTQNGMVIISTPQREYRLNDGQKPWSYGHKREYTKVDFENEIKNVFPFAKIYQMTGDKNLLLVEYYRVFNGRNDCKIYGGEYPQKNKSTCFLSLKDLFLQAQTTNDSINLYAIISPEKLQNDHCQHKITIDSPNAPAEKFSENFVSSEFWETRYAIGQNSGAGSYNKLALFKAKILNDYIKKHTIQSVIEFGCGDGNQLALAEYPQYQGFDVSPTSIYICREKFSCDKSKTFDLVENYNGQQADLVLSLDVIYHLVEDDVFQKYMKTLFSTSLKYVIVYSSNSNKIEGFMDCPHIKHRKFTEWIDQNVSGWKLIKTIPNKYPFKKNQKKGSFADFYFFEKLCEITHR